MNKFVAFSAALCVGLVASPALATSVTVLNPGFENPVLTTYPFYSEGPPGSPAGIIDNWGQQSLPTVLGGYGRSGIWAPDFIDPGSLLMGGVHGRQAGYAGNGTSYGDNGAFLYQNVGPAVAGANYTLTVDIGQRTDYASGTYEIALGTVAGGTFTPFAFAFNPVAPAPGTWATATLNYLNGVSTGDLYIILAGGLGVGQAQAHFDNVGLSYTAIDAAPLLSSTPLPAALPLFAGGLGLIGLLVRRKRKSIAD